MITVIHYEERYLPQFLHEIQDLKKLVLIVQKRSKRPLLLLCLNYLLN